MEMAAGAMLLPNLEVVEVVASRILQNQAFASMHMVHPMAKVGEEASHRTNEDQAHHALRKD